MKYLLCISFFMCLMHAADDDNGAKVALFSSQHTDDDKQEVKKSKSMNDISSVKKRVLRMHGGASTTLCPNTPAHIAIIKTLEGSSCTKMCPWHCKSKGDSPHPYADHYDFDSDSSKEKKRLKKYASENKEGYFELSDSDE